MNEKRRKQIWRPKLAWGSSCCLALHPSSFMFFSYPCCWIFPCSYKVPTVVLFLPLSVLEAFCHCAALSASLSRASSLFAAFPPSAACSPPPTPTPPASLRGKGGESERAKCFLKPSGTAPPFGGLSPFLAALSLANSQMGRLWRKVIRRS